MTMTLSNHTTYRIMNNTLNWTPGDAAAEQVAQVSRFVTRLVAQVSAGFRREAAARRGFTDLEALSERELNDIGLTRWDVLDAAEATSAEEASRILLAHRAVRRVQPLTVA